MSTTLTPIADAMTAADLIDTLNDLRASLGTRAEVAVVLGGYTCTYPGSPPIHMCLRPDGYGFGKTERTINGASWPEAMDAARQWIANYKITSRDTTIRKMTLAIIELTDEHGKCTSAMLTRREFSADQIEAFHELACQRAGEMCGNAPFRVEFV